MDLGLTGKVALVGGSSRGLGRAVDHLILSSSLRAAVTGFARTLANEVATHGVT